MKGDLHRITLVQSGADNAQHDRDRLVERHAVQRLVKRVLLGLRLRQALRDSVVIDGRGVAAAFDVGHAGFGDRVFDVRGDFALGGVVNYRAVHILQGFR